MILDDTGPVKAAHCDCIAVAVESCNMFSSASISIQVFTIAIDTTRKRKRQDSNATGSYSPLILTEKKPYKDRKSTSRLLLAVNARLMSHS